jgi:hypothetical protein
MGKGTIVRLSGCWRNNRLKCIGLLLAAVFTCTAWAGSYSVEYSGGRAKIESINYAPPPPDESLPTWYKPYVDQVGSRWGVSATPKEFEGDMGPETLGGKASCGEEITATFQWSGPEDPPSSVVVKEECTASYTGPAGARNTTLPVVGTPTTTSETGERYTVVNNPGQSFTVNCTPTSFVEGAYPTRTSTSISYKAAIVSPTVFVNSFEFQSGHGVLTDWTTDYGTDGGNVYTFQGWRRLAGNPPGPVGKPVSDYS